MKKLLTVLALTTVVASPALAASSRYHRYAFPSQDPYAAHATYQGRDGVIIENRYGGWDPDANIRLEQRRDALSGHE